MKDHFRWGDTFQAVINEFSTDELRALQTYCKKLIADAGTLGAAIPFERDGYQFELRRDPKRVWSLEVVQFPPHCPRGRGGNRRVLAARKQREKDERKQGAVAARPQRVRKPLCVTDNSRELLIVMSSAAQRSEFGHKLFRISAGMDALSHNVEAQWRSVTLFVRAKVREIQISYAGLRRRTRHYVAKLDVANWNLEKRIDTTLEIASGMRLESRLYTIGRLQLQLNTWAPIDPGFDQIWDTSLFGVRLLESENL